MRSHDLIQKKGINTLRKEILPANYLMLLFPRHLIGISRLEIQDFMHMPKNAILLSFLLP